MAQNSKAERPKKPRGPGKPFTGSDDPRRNNGGVPEVVRKLQKMLREDGAEEAVAYLRRCVRGEELDVYVTMSGKVKRVPMKAKERISAAGEVMAYGVPKPKGELEITGKDGAPLNPAPVTSYDLSKLSVEELITWKKLRAKAKLADDGSAED